MRLPGFTAVAAFHMSRERCHSGLTIGRPFTNDGSAVIPAQQYACCQTATGTCIARLRGTSTAALAGFSQTCRGLFESASVTVCRDVDSGGITAVSRQCSPCGDGDGCAYCRTPAQCCVCAGGYWTGARCIYM